MPADGRLATVRRSFGAYESGDRGVLDEIRSEDFMFSSPPDPGIDRETYFERCWPNRQLLEKFAFRAAD